MEALNHGADNHSQKGRRPMAQFKELREVMAQLANRYRANRMSGTTLLNVGTVGRRVRSRWEALPKDVRGHDRIDSKDLIPRTAEGNVHTYQGIKKEDGRTGDAQADRTIDVNREETENPSPIIPIHPMTLMPGGIDSSEGIYQELMKNLPNSIVMLYDLGLRCLLLEGGGLESSGLEGAAIEGKTVCEAFPDGPLNQCEETYHKVLQGEGVTDLISSCGRTYKRFSIPLKCEDGNVYGGMVMCHDITDVKEAEENLRRSNRSLRVLAAGQQAGFHTADESGLLETACSELASATGHPITYAIMVDGKGMPRIVASSGCGGALTGAVLSNLPPLVPGPSLTDPSPWRDHVGELPKDRWQAYCARDLVSLPLHYHDDAIGALVLFDPEEGSFPPEEIELLREVARDISWSISALRDHKGIVRSHEVLSRKGEQMQQLSLSTRKLSSTLDEWSVLRTLMRATRELLRCETCMVGMRVGGRLLFHEVDQGGVIRPIDLEVIIGDEALGRALGRMEPYVDDNDCIGRYRNLAVVPLVNGDRHLAGALWAQDRDEGGFQQWDLHLMGTLADSAMDALNNTEMIRRLKVRENELEQVNRKLSLVGNITSHDLLNHLTTLRGYLELVGMHDGQTDHLGKALTSASNISSHILFALDYLEMGTQSPMWVTLRETVNRGASTVGKGEVRLEMRDDGVELYADRMIEKVFHNLLDNSISHGNASTVKITTGEGQDGLVIVYEDDGVGIPDGRKKRMFELTSEHRGMHLTREILALTGMEIAERGVAGEGARFEITVPKGSYRYRSLTTSD